MSKKHKGQSAPVGTTGEHEVWTLCGLGEHSQRFTEHDFAQNDEDVTCKSCLRIMHKKSTKI